METLYLHDNNIVDIDENAFENLKNLKYLDLENNLISKVIFDYLGIYFCLDFIN